MAITKSIFFVDRINDYLTLHVCRLPAPQVVEKLVLRLASLDLVSYDVEKKILYLHYGAQAPLAFLDVEGLAYQQILSRLENTTVPETSGLIQKPKP